MILLPPPKGFMVI